MSKFRPIDLHDRDQGEIKLLVSIPTRDDPWGACGLLRGTEWEPLIQVVDGEALSHALHGWATPLARQMGIAARYRGKKLSEEGGRCALVGECLMAGPQCHPSQKDLPDCYVAPDLPPDATEVASTVALSWRDNRLVVVVEGEEHALGRPL